MLGEGFSAVIESVEAGLGAPDPQQLAEMNRMAFKIKGETSDSEDGWSHKCIHRIRLIYFSFFRTRSIHFSNRKRRFSNQSRWMAEFIKFRKTHVYRMRVPHERQNLFFFLGYESRLR